MGAGAAAAAAETLEMEADAATERRRGDDAREAERAEVEGPAAEEVEVEAAAEAAAREGATRGAAVAVDDIVVERAASRDISVQIKTSGSVLCFVSVLSCGWSEREVAEREVRESNLRSVVFWPGEFSRPTLERETLARSQHLHLALASSSAQPSASFLPSSSRILATPWPRKKISEQSVRLGGSPRLVIGGRSEKKAIDRRRSNGASSSSRRRREREKANS